MCIKEPQNQVPKQKQKGHFLKVEYPVCLVLNDGDRLSVLVKLDPGKLDKVPEQASGHPICLLRCFSPSRAHLLPQPPMCLV